MTKRETYGEANIGNVTPETFGEQDRQFQELQLNLIKVHVVSEVYGADCFERSTVIKSSGSNGFFI